MTPYYGFDLRLPVSDVEHFSRMGWLFAYILWKIFYSSFLPLFKSFFVCLFVPGVPYILWILTLYQIRGSQIFSPIP